MSEIAFKKQGSGHAVILLHGFPMNRDVWNEWAPALAEDFTVYTPDLPGFGNSAPLADDFSLEQIAARMLGWMDEAHLKRAAVVGHSMGGYVALEMVRQRPGAFNSLTLFHSTALGDSKEKKASRTKVLTFIDQNGVQAFTSNFIAPLYADAAHPSIPAVREITMKATAPAVKGYTTAMRDRPDMTAVLRDFKNPVLIITGDKDPGIAVETIIEQSRIASNIDVVVLRNTGHMGMFERPEETLTAVKTFILNLGVR